MKPDATEEAYLAAIDLVDKCYESQPWLDDKKVPKNPNLGPPPEREEINKCLRRILLVQDSGVVSDKFLQCIGIDGSVSPTYRMELINLMRKDLYGAEMRDVRVSNPIFFKWGFQDGGPLKPVKDTSSPVERKDSSKKELQTTK